MNAPDQIRQWRAQRRLVDTNQTIKPALQKARITLPFVSIQHRPVTLQRLIDSGRKQGK